MHKLIRLCCFIVGSGLTIAAYAQSYPNKPIRLILPFPAGAPSDMVGRAVAQKLAEQLGENVLLVHPSVPAKTLKQFIALARAHPGKLNFGSGGPGTTNHLANELLKSETARFAVIVRSAGLARE